MKSPSLETVGRYCMTLSALGACGLIAWECAAGVISGIKSPQSEKGGSRNANSRPLASRCRIDSVVATTFAGRMLGANKLTGKREGNSARISDGSATASELLLGYPSRRESDKSRSLPCRLRSGLPANTFTVGGKLAGVPDRISRMRTVTTQDDRESSTRDPDAEMPRTVNGESISAAKLTGSCKTRAEVESDWGLH